jgi:putative tributyrin esterase
VIWSDFHFFSQTLGIQTAAYVLMPEAESLRETGGRPLPTLYLLHGLSDDHTAWLRNTCVQQYARDYRLAVVMPAVNRSFYTDMAHGAKYWTFVSEELPAVMESCFPLSKKREERFAAGLSMGGYGAMKLGLALPDRYAAVASLSGALMVQLEFESAIRQEPDWARQLNDVFGSVEAFLKGDDNLTVLADRLAPQDAPRLYAACGTADFIYPQNQAFISLYGAKFGIRYDTEEGAAHTWDFWDREIKKVLAWLPLERLEHAQ